MTVAWNPSTNAKTLTELAKDRYAYVRRALPWNHNTPKAVIEKLQANKAQWEQDRLGLLSTDAMGVLTTLSYDDDRFVRADVAANPHTPADVLTELSEDHEHVVRNGLRKNPMYHVLVVDPPVSLRKTLGSTARNLILRTLTVSGQKIMSRHNHLLSVGCPFTLILKSNGSEIVEMSAEFDKNYAESTPAKKEESPSGKANAPTGTASQKVSSTKKKQPLQKGKKQPKTKAVR